MTLKFSDGMQFDTSGDLRKEQRFDGWYVVGRGMLVPCVDEKDADELIKLFNDARKAFHERTEDKDDPSGENDPSGESTSPEGRSQ